MSWLDKLLKKTAGPNDIDLMLTESVRDLIKARYGKKDEEEETEHKKCRLAHKCRDFEPHDGTEENEKKCRHVGECEDFEEEKDKARKSRSKKAKEDVKPFLGDDKDEGIDETEINYDEPEDEPDEEAEEEAAERQKRVAKRSQKSRKAKIKEQKDIQDTIDEDQEEVYFDEDEDDDLPGSEYNMPEEEGHEHGIITNYGRRIKGRKAKKSLQEENPMADLLEIMGNVAVLLDGSLKQMDKLTKSTAVIMKSLQKLNGDMELVKSQTPGYPMQPLMYAPPAKGNSGQKVTYHEEQVRDALIKGMQSGQVDPELLRDFEGWIGRPGASVTEWVTDSLDETTRKALGL